MRIAHNSKLKTQNSKLRVAGGFPPSPRIQSFHLPTPGIHPLQELRLNSSHRSLLLYQLEERRPTERTRAKIKAEVSTSVKPPLRLADFRHSRQEALYRLQVLPQPFLSLLLVAHRASRHTLGMPIPACPHTRRASVRFRPIPLKLLQFVNQYVTCSHNSKLKIQHSTLYTQPLQPCKYTPRHLPAKIQRGEG